MVEYNYLHFLNLQYWYCVIYSIFGGECKALEAAREGATLAVGGMEGVVTTSSGPWTFVGDSFGLAGAFLGGLVSVAWALFSALSYTVSGLLILLILGSLFGILYIRYQEIGRFSTLPAEPRIINPRLSRWGALLEDATSTDPKRWRKSVLEADNLLGELLEKLGYAGFSTAQRLRSVPEGAFVTLPVAWEAHRIKNFVGARLSNYILTQREAFRVMKLYEQVFEEFDFI